MPFFEASSAASRRRMLRYKNRMSSKRCLLAIVRRLGRSEASANEIVCMLQHSLHSFGFEVIALFHAKRKCAPE